MSDHRRWIRPLRAVIWGVAALLWLAVCSTLCMTGLLELWYPNQPRWANGVLVFYLGIGTVGFPLGTLAFYAVGALTSGLSATARIWVDFVTVLLVGGLQWLVLLPAIVRLVITEREQKFTTLGLWN